MTPEAVLEVLRATPHTPLGHYPTPLIRARRLEAEVGPKSPAILVKLDTYTAFAVGGNKVRKLEYELAPERLEGATHLVTCGGAHSNHARVTAAAAARLGLDCTLILNGPEPDVYRGNALLDRLFGAHIRWVESRDDRPGVMEVEAREIRERGGSPLIVPLGASTPRGALGYARAAAELAGQLRTHPEWAAASEVGLVVPSSSCGTLAGLTLGFGVMDDPRLRLLGVSADASAQEILAETENLARGAAGLVGWPLTSAMNRVEATDAWVGGGYGVPTTASRAATDAFARLEGIVLDPVYTAKAGAAALALARSGSVDSAGIVVFLHTGGHPTALA